MASEKSPVDIDSINNWSDSMTVNHPQIPLLAQKVGRLPKKSQPTLTY